MNKQLFKVFSLITVLALVLMALPMQNANAAGSISLTALGNPYTQDFDTLSNTAGSTTNNLTINGWYLTESGGGARDNEQYAVDTGSSTTGDTYSYGAAGSTERALGALRSGTLIPIFGANFTNNTGSTITSLDIAYSGEEWRLGTAGRTDQINFVYSLNATDLTTGTWISAASLNFVTPDTATVGAKNGNAAGERTALSATISGLSIPNGTTFWIGWTDTDASGADDGLAVDDFSLTPNSNPAPTNPTGTGAATPSSVAVGASTLLTVTVTPGANPASTGLGVSCDLTAIGGAGSQAFFDDNTNGDIAAGDNIFSFQTTVPNATTAGSKSLPCTITDSFPRSGSASISLTVQALQSTASVVISQIYGGAGCGTAGCSTYTNDYIELYNRSASPVNLSGWSVQYAAAGGTSWQTTALSGTVAPGMYFLVQEGGNANGISPLPTPNATGSINMAAGAAKVALVSSTTALSGTCPLGGSTVDFVGYGTTANCSEGNANAPAPSTTTAIFRAGNGATDTDNNASDFAAAAPNPRNTPPPINLSISDVTLNEGNSGTTTFTFVVSLTSPAGAGGVTFDIAAANDTATAPSDFAAKSLTGQTILAGSSSYSFDVLVNGDLTDEPDETFFVNVTNVTGVSAVTDGQGVGTILNDDVDFCSVSYTPIYQIQGSGLTPAITGPVATKGVVVGDYEGPSPAQRGFFIQDPAGDGNATTSDGIFVFNGNNNSVSLGDMVYVSGTAGDFQDQTQISNVTNIANCGTGTVAPTDVTFPVPSPTFLEQYEGMLVRLPQTMYVTEHFQLGRFGQVVLSVNGKLKQPTNVVAPGVPALALQAQNDLSKIVLDDDLQSQNPDPILFGRGGLPLSASNTLRGGDTATNIVGVMTYTWSGNAASGNAYRLRPINALGGGSPNFQPANPRPAVPAAVGGTVRVVGMNLLNFFNTFTGCKVGVTNVSIDCRGATSQQEFDRQWPKTVAAILAMNPDVLGVNELENDGYGPNSALQFLTDKLNAATAPGTYAFIDVDANTGQVNAMGSDAIRIALLYKPAVVTPVGQTAPLNTVAFVNGGDSAPRNRPSLAQAFKVNSTGAVFIVDLNHLKSKGSACDAPDAGDGQGNCNQVRVNAVNELLSFFAADPTGTGDPDILMIGDYNSYAKEDPITALKNGGFTNLVESFIGPDAYSYVFDGQWGYLDQALGSASLVNQVTGVADYHINSDEPSVLDYLEDFKSPGQLVSLYAPDQYRVSDHDPVVIGLTPNAPPTVNAGGSYSVNEGSSVTLNANGSDPNGDSLTYAWDLDNNGSFETSGQSASFSAAALDGPSSYTVKVKATDPGGLSATSTATVDVKNVAPTVTLSGPTGNLSCGSNNASLTVSFSDPGVADTHTAVIIWGDGNTETISPATSPFSRSHTYALVGTYTANVTVTDDDGDSGSASKSMTVNYNTTGILQPVNSDGTSVFKFGSTIPVKIRFTNCNGTIPSNLAPTIKLTMVSGSTPGLEINEPISTSAADTSGVMRFSTDQYIYNLATKPLPDSTATYRITITVPSTGQTVNVNFGLK
jgi:uncharacterized protein